MWNFDKVTPEGSSMPKLFMARHIKALHVCSGKILQRTKITNPTALCLCNRDQWGPGVAKKF